MGSGAATLDSVYRAEWGGVVAALIRHMGDFDLAEEALRRKPSRPPSSSGPSTGVPESPRAWLISDRAASRRIDRVAAGGPDSLTRSPCTAIRRCCDRSPGRETETRRPPRRPAAADLHLLPPGARVEAQVALTLRDVVRPRRPRRSPAPSSYHRRRWPSGWCAPSGNIERGAPLRGPRAEGAAPAARRGPPVIYSSSPKATQRRVGPS